MNRRDALKSLLAAPVAVPLVRSGPPATAVTLAAPKAIEPLFVVYSDDCLSNSFEYECGIDQAHAVRFEMPAQEGMELMDRVKIGGRFVFDADRFMPGLRVTLELREMRVGQHVARIFTYVTK